MENPQYLNNSNQDAPLVSVITPVYNGEEFLRECIESVINQTYQNWHYVIVNNCSKDRSLEIAQSYAEKDSRIEIIDNEEFLSALGNQNKAIRQIHPQSKYCKVVHADDWLFPECISKMVDLAEKNPSVGIVGAYIRYGDLVFAEGLPYEIDVISGREICRSVLKGRSNIFGSPSSILIKSELIRQNDPFYNEPNLQADIEVCLKLLQESDFGFVHQMLTYSRKHNRQVTSYMHRVKYFPVAKIKMHHQYGHIYLNPQENRYYLQQRLEKYHKILGKALFRSQDPEMWDFHRKELKALGYSANRMMISVRYVWCVGVELAPKAKRVIYRKLGAIGIINRKKPLVSVQ